MNRSRSGKPKIPDDAPTVDEAAPNFDPTRTDAARDGYTVSLDYTGEFASGVIDHDDRGQARWKWNSESTPTGETERTFDLLKALNNDALTIEGSPKQESEKPKRQSGYNPYDVGGADTKPKPRKK